MKFTGQGNVSIHESEGVTLFHAEQPEDDVPVVESRSVASEKLFPDIYFRIYRTGKPGELEVRNVYYWFNSINGFKDPVPDQPDLGVDAAVTVPLNSTGAIYFQLTLYPVTAWALAFYATAPTPSRYLFIRPLANVTRGDGDAVTFSQRHFGLITVPSQMLFSAFL